MIEIGRYNKLMILQRTDFGLYLDGEEHDKILIPKRYVEKEYALGDFIEAFVYFDSEDRIIATTETPLVQVGEFAALKAVSVTNVGAFMDWGLMKDLFVPFKEQIVPIVEGETYVVSPYYDKESNRLAGTTRLGKFLSQEIPKYELEEEVELLVCDETEIGYRVVVEMKFWGLLYKNEVFKEIKAGDIVKGFVKKIRDDFKIDVSLQKGGFEKVDLLEEQILNKLKESNGYLPLNDKSPSEEIYSTFETSKKTFKKSIGALYKKKLILIKPDGIHLV